MTFGMWCNWMEAARFSQNAGRQAAKFGATTPIAAPATYVDGEILRRRLEDAGIRATLATTLDGPSLLVWPQDVDRARAIITAR